MSTDAARCYKALSELDKKLVIFNPLANHIVDYVKSNDLDVIKKIIYYAWEA